MAQAAPRTLTAEDRARANPVGLARLTVPNWKLMPITSLINRVFWMVTLASLRPDDRELDKWRRVILALPPRTGKALEVETPVPTPLGWARMIDLEPGDWVFGSDGQPCRVMATSEIWRNRPLYEVKEARTGTSVFTDAEHEWLGRWNRAKPMMRTGTSEELWRKAQTWQRPALWVPPNKGLDTPPLPLPIDPWLLGYWLGDGTSAHAALTIGIHDVGWVTAELDRSGQSWHYLGNGGRTNSRVLGLRGGFQSWLRHLGILGDKRIPSLYLRAGLAQRRALLQGIVDSDGGVSPDGTVAIDFANERLARDLQELLASLGIQAAMSHGYSQSQSRWGFHRWRTSFIAVDVARMPRKAGLLRAAETGRARYVTAEPVGSGDTVCIQVDSPDRLFLAGPAMLPTHNSEICSINGPAWYLGHNPDKMIGVVSYEATFAEGFGALARNALNAYGVPIFGVTTDPSSEAKNWWGVIDYASGKIKRGGMRASGWEGFGVGKGFNVLVMDDMLKDAQMALSPQVRQAQFDFWQSTASTRLEPGGAALLVMQRWHGDDLAGRVMQEEGLFGEVGRGGWTPIIVPLRAEPITSTHIPGLRGEMPDPLGRKEGELLVTRFSDEELAARERTTSEFWWAAQYQQRPSAKEGTLFMRQSMRFYEVLPDYYRLLKQGINWLVPKGEVMVFITTDLASSTKTSADYFVLAIWAVTRNRDLLLLDLVRGRYEGPDQDAIVQGAFNMVWPKPAFVAIESVAYQMTMVQRMRRKGIPVRPVTADRDKYARAVVAATRFNNEGIFLPAANRPWKNEYISEHLNFPNAAHDDQVDVTGYAAICIEPDAMSGPGLRVIG